MNLKKDFLILIILINSYSIFAQQFQANEQVRIHQDARIDSLVSFHRVLNEYSLANEEHNGIEGYRIHLFFESGNNSKARTMSVRDEFLKRYPEVGAYVIYGSPYYRLRVGDFRSKVEAERFLQQIIRRYPAAYVIKTKIKFPQLD